MTKETAGAEAAAGADGSAEAKATQAGRRYAIERSLAPHVDALWTEAVLLELRLQGVAGTTIAGVLTEVEAHVVDSGEDALTAFGDPVQYARSLDLPSDPHQNLAARPAVVALYAAQVVGAVMMLGGAAALGAREPAAVTWGLVCSAVLATLVGLVVIRNGDQVLRFLVTARARSARSAGALVGGVALVGLVALPAALMRTVAFELPGAVSLGAGALLLASTVVVSVRQGRREPDDLVVSPFDAPAPASHRGTWIAQLALVVPVALTAVALYVLGRALG